MTDNFCHVVFWLHSHACGDDCSADEKSPVIKEFHGLETKMDVYFKFPQSGCKETDLPREIGFEWSESYLLAKAYYLAKQVKRENIRI